jgi:hypothetical protein
MYKCEEPHDNSMYDVVHAFDTGFSSSLPTTLLIIQSYNEELGVAMIIYKNFELSEFIIEITMMFVYN